MSRRIALVTDSTAALTAELCRQYQVHVIPTMLHWGATSYRDGVDVSAREFFERLRTDPVHPTTSAFSIGAAQQVYRQAAEGAEGVVGIHISPKLSGVYGVAVQARDLMPELNIRVVDARSTSMALGFVVAAAAEAADAGAGLDEVAAVAERASQSVGLLITPETLVYLQRGGRIGAAAAFVGGVLDLKPVLDLQDGSLVPLERVRSRKKALARTVEVAAQRLAGKTDIRLAAIHANAEDVAREMLGGLRPQIRGSIRWEGVADVSPTVGAHAGPGTVGFAYTWGF
jgi:DegV family protein with EDD domain